ncbi:MAG: PspC domain-containing protein [Chloroflexota bacterium]
MASERSNAPGRQLTRRTHDRVIGGVASGVGDYLGIDPLLIRIGFAGLMIFGGAGLVLYLIAWLLLPAEGHSGSMLEELLRGVGLTPRRIVWVAAIVVGTVFILSQPISTPLGGGWLIRRMDGPVPLAIGVVIVGILLLRGRGKSSAAVAAPATAIRVDAQPQVATVSVVQAASRPRSPLGWYVFAAVLLGIGALALVSNVAAARVLPGQFFGAALAVLGIGLMVGAWWGRARILILLGLLLIPVAVTASFVTAPLEGGVGDLRYTPANAAELRDEYRLMGGRLILDLSGLSVTSSSSIHVAASVAIGQLVVILPKGASLEVESRIGAGAAWILNSSQGGTSLQDRVVRHQLGMPTYVLDLEAGIGEVDVYSDTGGGG